MVVRLLPVSLVLAAIAADAHRLGEPAFYLLVAGVAAAAVSALSLFGDLIELPARGRATTLARLETLLAALGLVCVLVAAAARGQATAADVPALAGSALVTALAVYGAQTVTALFRPRQKGRAAAPSSARSMSG